MHVDSKGRMTVAQLINCEVKVFVGGYFEGFVHIEQDGDIIAIANAERIDALIEALNVAKQYANQ